MDPFKIYPFKPLCKVPLASLFLITIIVIMSETGIYAQAEVTFYFNPPDETSFTETVRTSREIIFAGEPQSEGSITESSANYFIRRNPTGYTVVVTPISDIGMVSDDISELMASVMSNMVLKYDLNSNGQLTGIRGVEEGLQSVKETLPIPEEMWEMVIQMMSFGQSPEQMFINNWNNRGMFGLFVGRTLVLNEVYSFDGQLPLPDGNMILASVEITVSGYENCMGNDCVRIQVNYRSDDSIAGEAITEVLRNMMYGMIGLLDEGGGNEELADDFLTFDFIDPYIIYSTVRVVDPATGLIYSEVESKKMSFTLDLKDEDDIKFRMVDKIEYRYVY